MRTFAELLAEYMQRTGISDTELARALGVRRQTIFRWKEGLVERPRHQEDVLRCAAKLRLMPHERDALLISSGYAPADVPADISTVGPDAAGDLPQVPPPEAAISQTKTAAPPSLALRLRGTAISVTVPRARRSRQALTWGAVLFGVAAVAIAAFMVARWLPGIAYPRAGADETLVVVAPFVNYTGGAQGYNVAGRVQAALSREMEAARLPGGRAAAWPVEIREESQAQEAAQRSGAVLIIWGEYDSGRVLAHLTAPASRSDAGERLIEKPALSPGELSTVINTALPEETRYVALRTLGQLYADRGDYARARAILTQALARPPADKAALASLYFLLGYAHQLGQPPELDQAIERYSQALALSPEIISAYNNRGIAYLGRDQAGDAALAAGDLTRVIEADPENAAAHNNRGTAYLSLAKAGATPTDRPSEALDRAIADFDRAVTLAPGAPEAYFNRALAYIRRGETARWLQDLDRVLVLDPDHLGAHIALCWAYALDAQPEQALPFCERAVALDPNGPARDSRGIVYAQMGQYGEAIADFEAYLASLREQGEARYQQYGPRREAWLIALRAGRNPFDSATLERLRQE